MNFNLFCVRLTHKGFDPSDMELVNTEIGLHKSIHDIRYNTINLRMHLNRQNSDCNVAAESYISYGV